MLYEVQGHLCSYIPVETRTSVPSRLLVGAGVHGAGVQRYGKV